MSTVQKKVLKKKVVVNAQVVEDVQGDVQQQDADNVETAVTVDNNSFVIPSSRVHNYVSGVKLNKEIDDKINKIKSEGFEALITDSNYGLTESDITEVNAKVESSKGSNEVIINMLSQISGGADLSTVLSVEDQKKVGDIVKNIEAKNAKAEGEPETINLVKISVDFLNKKLVTKESACVDILSKQRAKFSKESFDVLSAFGDMVVEEITTYALERLSDVGNSTIEPKYVFSSSASEGSLYGYYSTLPSFVKIQSLVLDEEAKKEQAKQLKKEQAKQLKKAMKNGEVSQTDTVDEQVQDEEVEVQEPVEDEKKINFKFYVKSIVYNLKTKEEKYSNTKVSERYQSFCSDIVLDILDNVVDLSQIILNVMSTKTISAKLFKTCLYTQLYKLPQFDNVKESLEKRLC
jgi:hypothetical protein